TTSIPPALLLDCEPGFGRGADKFTRSVVCATAGMGRSSSSLKSEKIAALAPIPRASDNAATMVTNGDLKSVRRASLTLRIGRRERGDEQTPRTLASSPGLHQISRIAGRRGGRSESPGEPGCSSPAPP